MELAWEIALNHIAYNGFISDRSTKLNCRLVAKNWRTHSALSDTITSITLHSLDDADRLIKYYPLTPCIRSPWQTLEESRIFPNLTLIRISLSSGFCYQLNRFPNLDAFKAACAQFELSINAYSLQSLRIQLPLLKSLGKVTSLKVGEGREVIPMNSHPSLLSSYELSTILSLTELTRLTLIGLPMSENLYDLKRLKSLTGLGSLQHLEVEMVFDEVKYLPDALKTLACLTQVTQLELTLDMNDGFDSDPVDMTEIEMPLQLHAPPSLKQCRLRHAYNRITCDHQDVAIYLDRAIFKCGKLLDCHFGLLMLSVESMSIDSVLEHCIKQCLAGKDVQRLTVYVMWDNNYHRTNPVFGTNTLKDIKELELNIKSEPLRFSSEPLRPILWKVNGPPLSTTYLACRFGGRRVDYTNMLSQLPLALPYLQQLQLYDMGTSPRNLNILSQLSCLTSLTLDSSCMGCYQILYPNSRL